jgi:uncharacterized protein
MHTIIKVRVGSHCHGTNMPESDTDIRSVFIPTKDYFLGLKRCEQIEEKQDGKDIEHWNIHKLISLCLKGNPAALNVLFVRKVDQLECDEWGLKLYDIRNEFLSRRTISAIIGYCISQIHKLTIGRGAKEGQRGTLIEKYGYDVKFVYHAVMLTNMGIELCKTGDYRPYRGDIEQHYLRSIRRGEIPLEDVRHQIEENLKTIKTIESICPLPTQPNEERMNLFITNFLWDYYQKEKK